MISFLIAGHILPGAFGAHALGSSVTPERLAVWETAAQYHLIHAVVLLVLATRTTGAVALERWVVAGFTLGVLLFSFSLYALVLTDVSRFAMVTPVGGFLLMLSWLAISWHALSRKEG